jgi:uncharacterized protein (TIGR02001 family)
MGVTQMKKTLLAVALASSLTSFGAVAADKAPEPDFSLSANIGVVSDYKFRGISQTDGKAAVQGGVDLSHKSGAYIGTWASNVSDWTNTGGKNAEVDLYGGYRFSLPGDISADAGYILYSYPANQANPKQSTQEAYLGLGYGPISYKFSITTGNWFGFCADSGGSTYHDLALSHSVSDKISISAHVGKQDVKCSDVDSDFVDYKIGATYAFSDSLSASANYITVTGLSAAAKTGKFTGGDNEKLYDSAFVISVLKTF